MASAKKPVMKITEAETSKLFLKTEEENYTPKSEKKDSFWGFEFNCDFLDLKSDDKDTAMPKRTRQVERSGESSEVK